ncbi:MAG: hypothetical protein SynsKO_22520 [Synoicihabitans sp.]
MRSLEKLLGISIQEFMDKFHLRKHLFKCSNSSNAFNDLLELKDLDVYLATVPLKHGQVTLINNNKRPRAEQFLKLNDGYVVDNTLDMQKVFKLLDEGMTIILTDMSKHIPKLGIYCNQLENQLGVRVQANIYITPAESQGFQVHVDSHDVFVLQIFGEKTWRVYDGLEDSPTKSLILKMPKFDEKKHILLDEINVSKGELLYIPQGMYHAAQTRDKPSIHITLGILPRRRSELLDMIFNEAKEGKFFRKSVPSRLYKHEDFESFSKEFKKACHQIIDEANIDQLTDRVYQQFLEKQSQDLTGHLSDTLQMGDLTLNSRVKRRSDARFWIEEQNYFTVVHHSQHKLQVPKPIAHVLKIILADEAFRPTDIDPMLSDKVKLNLVKKFLGSGILRILQL